MVGNDNRSPDFAVIRCVDWLQRRGEAVNLELWEGIYELARTARRASVRLRARQLIADRIDPVPRAPVLSVETGPVSLTWAGPSASHITRDPSSNGSTTSSPLDALGPPSSSATDDLASL
jgi:hypothetical protein